MDGDAAASTVLKKAHDKADAEAGAGGEGKGEARGGCCRCCCVCCCCCRPHAGSEASSEGGAGWWRPTMLLLLLVLLLVVFVLISGILLYYNYITYRPRLPLTDDFSYDIPPMATEEPCDESSCWWGAECESVEGRPVCRCREDCPPPPPDGAADAEGAVCGSDGATYPSECQLRAKACASRDDTRLSHHGPCETSTAAAGPPDPCASLSCGEGEECVAGAGGLGPATCRCRDATCSPELAPVCASDGKTYSNECALRREACRTHRAVRLLHHGACNLDVCDGWECGNYAICESDGRGGAHCACVEECADTESPVCGSDGVTYKNICELQKYSCLEEIPISIVKEQPCDDCEGELCWTQCGPPCPSAAPQEAVCRAGRAYPSACHARRDACLAAVDVGVLTAGPCPDTSSSAGLQATAGATASPSEEGEWPYPESCEESGCELGATCERPAAGGPAVCACRLDCAGAPRDGPLCASDLRVYPSTCAMHAEACQAKRELRLRPMELCQGLKVRPCGGDAPLVHPGTGRPYDCGSGPARQDCPPGAYCHQTAHFARCCAKAHKGFSEVMASCETSTYGCCPDGKTPAGGPAYADCPSFCGCNKLGALSDSCDPLTKQCICKPGVGGLKCDRCESGYWGLPKITEGYNGCTPCDCSVYGSVREDCEQMTGRCMCKSGVQGQKCTICMGLNMILTPSGCIEADDTMNNFENLKSGKRAVLDILKIIRGQA